MIGARIAAFFAGLWPKLAFAGAIVLALLGVYAGVRRAGRQDERNDQLRAGMTAITAANHAAAAVNPSSEAIANDPDNLDRR